MKQTIHPFIHVSMYVCIYLLFRITLQHIPLFLLWNPYFKTFAATLTFCWCYSLWLLLLLAFLCCTLTGCCCNQLRFGRFFFLSPSKWRWCRWPPWVFVVQQTWILNIVHHRQTHTHTEIHTVGLSLQWWWGWMMVAQQQVGENRNEFITFFTFFLLLLLLWFDMLAVAAVWCCCCCCFCWVMITQKRNEKNFAKLPLTYTIKGKNTNTHAKSLTRTYAHTHSLTDNNAAVAASLDPQTLWHRNLNKQKKLWFQIEGEAAGNGGELTTTTTIWQRCWWLLFLGWVVANRGVVGGKNLDFPRWAYGLFWDPGGNMLMGLDGQRNRIFLIFPWEEQEQ